MPTCGVTRLNVQSEMALELVHVDLASPIYIQFVPETIRQITVRKAMISEEHLDFIKGNAASVVAVQAHEGLDDSFIRLPMPRGGNCADLFHSVLEFHVVKIALHLPGLASALSRWLGLRARQALATVHILTMRRSRRSALTPWPGRISRTRPIVRRENSPREEVHALLKIDRLRWRWTRRGAIGVISDVASVQVWREHRHELSGVTFSVPTCYSIEELVGLCGLETVLAEEDSDVYTG